MSILWIALGATTLFAAVGFADDWIKIVKKRSLGLTGKQKLAGPAGDRTSGLGSALCLDEIIPGISVFRFLRRRRTDPATSISYVGPFIYLVLYCVHSCLDLPTR